MSGSTITTTGQYLTFTLDEETFALDIAKVREVLEFATLTRVPRMPDFMRGVINLRGSVVPVVDLRLKFGMSATKKSVDTCVIIAEVEIDGERTVLGALADSVEEVIDLEPDQIDPPPRMGTRLDSAFIRGMGKRNEQFIILLDIDRVFTAEDIRSATGEGFEDALPKGVARAFPESDQDRDAA